jgi:pimeloyl-ACP methyl ester carboxylesterase
VRLAIFSEGDPGADPVVLVHGYPDTHRVWDAVAKRLARTRYVVRYDVRGAGASEKPRGLRAYRLDRLADDLFTVLDGIARPVHLVGHDWGSIQGWEAVTDPRAEGRITRYTSISGPSLDHVGRLLRRTDVPGQRRRSWYVAAFHLPVLPEAVWRLGLASRWPEVLLRTEGIRVPPSATQAGDATHGLQLYRANVLPRLLRPRERRTRIPVQLITLTRDRYVSPDLAADLRRWAPNLRRDVVDAGHWSALQESTGAATIASLIDEFHAERKR